MKATQTLPENYQPFARLNIEDKRTQLILNIAGLVLLAVFGGLFFLWMAAFHSADFAAGIQFNLQIGQFLAAILALIIVLVLHEGIHGLAYWLLAGVRPVFAFKGAYAYAAAPGWYVARGPYLAIGLAPLVLLYSLGGHAGAWPSAPLNSLAVIYFAVVMNAAGAVGDLWVAVLLLRAPRGCLALDSGEEIQLFAPAA
jgi:hypothetical protein